MLDIDSIQPLQPDGVADYHCHCDYSIDAEGTIDEYCRAALKRNLAEICFTTHYDANPSADGRVNFIVVEGERKSVTPDNLQPYVEDVRRAAEAYFARGLSVKLGVEIGWYRGCERVTETLRNRFDFDYVLCGIHELENVCLCCRSTYEKCFSRYSVEEAVAKYFEHVITAARSGLFDAIAHLDYCVRYGYKYYGEQILPAHRPHTERVFNALVESGTGIEINTSAIRHGHTEYYPGMEIISAARRAGVDVCHLGSDAHKPEQVGYDFETAASLVPNRTRSCEG